MWLLFLALIGNFIPGGLFIYWLLNDSTSWSAAFSDKLALAFFLDLLISLAAVAYLFAKKQIGPYKWPWVVGLALIFTLAFAIPLYVWMNWRRAPGNPKFEDWWRTA